MQPYQKASEQILKQSSEPGELLKKAGKAALSIGVSAPIFGKVNALLNSFIPSNISAKGLSKVDSRFGKFINGVVNNGGSQDEALNFIKEKMNLESEEKSQGNAKQQQNIIEQYSPELNQFMNQEIQKGRSPIEAGALAQNDKRFSQVIKKLSKDHKANWSAILESIYGGGQMAQAQQPGQPQGGQQSQQPGQQQSGNVDQALMAAFDKILKDVK